MTEASRIQAAEHQANWNAHARGETGPQRLDRNLMELLQELRVAQTGVQILFAFLLTMPFQQRFALITTTQRNLYVATLICAALSGALLIAPVSFHRLVFRRRLKAHLVQAAQIMSIGGLAFLALAMVGAVMLVIDVVVGRGAALTVGALLVVWFGLLWYAWPFTIRLRNPTELEELTESDPEVQPSAK